LVAEFLVLNEDFPRSVRFCLTELNHALRRISGVVDARFSNDAEKLAGRLLGELQFSTIEEIFEQGFHAYLDSLQTKLNRIGDALCQAYIFHASTTALGDHLVQQEQQQQQQGRSVTLLTDGGRPHRHERASSRPAANQSGLVCQPYAAGGDTRAPRHKC
jgi:hypothetical protein